MFQLILIIKMVETNKNKIWFFNDITKTNNKNEKYTKMKILAYTSQHKHSNYLLNGKNRNRIWKRETIYFNTPAKTIWILKKIAIVLIVVIKMSLFVMNGAANSQCCQLSIENNVKYRKTKKNSNRDSVLFLHSFCMEKKCFAKVIEFSSNMNVKLLLTSKYWKYNYVLWFYYPEMLNFCSNNCDTYLVFFYFSVLYLQSTPSAHEIFVKIISKETHNKISNIWHISSSFSTDVRIQVQCFFFTREIL